MLVFLTLTTGILACSSSTNPAEPLPERPYPVADTQTKPPPVYYPVANVRSSSPGYKEFPSLHSKKVIVKRFNYDLPEATLCEVGQALATSFKYHYYCAPSLGERKYAVTKILTPYELKDLIEQENNVKVMIDSINREVRLLSGERIIPQFAK